MMQIRRLRCYHPSQEWSRVYPRTNHRLDSLDLLTDSLTEVAEFLLGGRWRMILNLHLHIAQRPQPKLSLGGGLRSEVVVVDEKATAVNRIDVVTSRGISDPEFDHGLDAQLVLVHHESRRVAAMCLQFTEQNGDRPEVFFVPVHKVPCHQTPHCLRHVPQGVASDGERGQQRICNQKYRVRNPQHPLRPLLVGLALFCRLNSKVRVGAWLIIHKRHLEALELRVRPRTETTVANHGERRQRHRRFPSIGRGEREAIHVQREANGLEPFLRGEVPHGTFAQRHTHQRLVWSSRVRGKPSHMVKRRGTRVGHMDIAERVRMLTAARP
mmetsp:Transcript_27310/g.71974  ORF Transcript_27310/g.71974 Transcript_27310/m.71974 type:complete len:326 (-) Transcript_27310:139-1116(-)